MTTLPLLWGDNLDAPLAWRHGVVRTRRQYLNDVQTLAEALPNGGPMLNLSGDRYQFAVGLGAALVRGQFNLMPPNHTPDMLARLRRQYAGVYGLGQDAPPGCALPLVRYPDGGASQDAVATPMPLIDAAQLCAQVLTSGSTGAPAPHPKHWGLLWRNARAGAQRLAEHLQRPSLEGVTLVATVPAQHMYGFESTVLIALIGGAAFDAERPFYPADIVAALARAARPRMLVTTPFHLKTLLDAGIELPAVNLVLSATAPLSPQLAARAEAALVGPLIEIYGCTEAGQVAMRRTCEGADWRTFDGLQLSGNGDQTVVQGGHVPQPTPLADVLEVVDATRFRLLGRANDLINVAGKRSSLSHLNFHLNSVPGVVNGAFWLPPDNLSGGVVRLTAFVVTREPDLSGLQSRVIETLRQRVDAAFVPRRVITVDALPREPGTGKLPASAFEAWADAVLARVGRSSSSP